MHMEGFSSAPYLKEGNTQRNSGHDEDVLLHPHFNTLLAALVEGGEAEKGGGFSITQHWGLSMGVLRVGGVSPLHRWCWGWG